MDEQCPGPCGERCGRPASIELITRIQTVGRGQCTALNAFKHRFKRSIMFGPFQNAECFFSKLGSPGTVLCLGVIAGCGPCLRDVQDPSLLREANPQVMVQQEMESWFKPANFLQG